jgi:hypothetical protein
VETAFLSSGFARLRDMPILAFLLDNARWLTVGVLLTFLSSFGQTYFISVFAGEIRAGFGLSHGEWGGIYTLGTTASALLMVWAGGVTNLFRVRVLAMALNPVWWLLPVIVFALRFTGQGMMSHLAVVAMARWFVATRGTSACIFGAVCPERGTTAARVMPHADTAAMNARLAGISRTVATGAQAVRRRARTGGAAAAHRPLNHHQRPRQNSQRLRPLV